MDIGYLSSGPGQPLHRSCKVGRANSRICRPTGYDGTACVFTMKQGRWHCRGWLGPWLPFNMGARATFGYLCVTKNHRFYIKPTKFSGLSNSFITTTVITRSSHMSPKNCTRNRTADGLRPNHLRSWFDALQTH